MPCRVVTPEDASALARIAVAAWKAAYRGLMPPEFLDALSAADVQTRWERVFAEGPPSVVVFERDQQVVASCHFGPSRDPDAKPGTAEVFSLNVHPDRWRRGLGSQLTRFALNRLRVERFDCVTLRVLRDNERAQRFYEALGFQRDSSERSTSDLIGTPLHELRYCMALEPAA